MHQDEIHRELDISVSAEHQYLGMRKNAVYGLQHVLTMYGGIIAPPLIIVATSLAIGMIPIVNQEFYAQFPIWVKTLLHSGISSACITAILLNVIFNHLPFGKSSAEVGSLPLNSGH